MIALLFVIVAVSVFAMAYAFAASIAYFITTNKFHRTCITAPLWAFFVLGISLFIFR